MFPPKKKPGLAILMGGKSDPESPDPLEKPAPKPMAKAATAASPMDDKSVAADEGGESAGYESSEQTGATLIKDIEGAGTNLGLDAAQSRSFAADVFSAMADCLRRGQSGGGEDTGNSGTDTGNSGAGEYPA